MANIFKNFDAKKTGRGNTGAVRGYYCPRSLS